MEYFSNALHLYTIDNEMMNIWTLFYKYTHTHLKKSATLRQLNSYFARQTYVRQAWLTLFIEHFDIFLLLLFVVSLSELRFWIIWIRNIYDNPVIIWNYVHPDIYTDFGRNFFFRSLSFILVFMSYFK